MKVDVLTYMMPDLAWSLNNHLASSQPGVNPTFSALVPPNGSTPGQHWLMKSANGYPWDMNLFDNNAVYQFITEVDPDSWTDPSTFKAFQSKSFPNGRGGIYWAPRWPDDSLLNPPVLTPDSSFAIFKKCAKGSIQYLSSNNATPIVTQVGFYKQYPFGGDLGTQDCMIQTYQWGTGLNTMEVNYFVKGYGHAQWMTCSLQNGLYVPTQTSLFNLIKSGGSPQPLFTCALPLI